MACWIFQGNPDDYDADEYFRAEPYVYWWVKHEKHQREMEKGDDVFFWRSAGDETKAAAGTVARGQVVERPVKRTRVLHPAALRDDLWKSGDPDPESLVAGVVLSEVRLTSSEGMLTRGQVAAHPVLRKLGVVTVNTGTNFRVKSEHVGPLQELWGAGGPPVGEDGSGGSREGSIQYRIHKTRERDPALAKEKKGRFREEYGFLACEVCGWRGEDHYGPLGSDLLEVHHTRPLSEMKRGEVTRVEDLMLLCPNCHRAVHRGDAIENLGLLQRMFSTE